MKLVYDIAARPRRLRRIVNCAAALLWLAHLCAASAPAQLQDGVLAIKTNGNLFRSGGNVRVELLALEPVREAFSAQIAYRWTDTIEERDEDGKITHKNVERSRFKPRTPIVESMDANQSLLLDDSFNLGEGSKIGRYMIEVRLSRRDARETAATIRADVFYDSYTDDGATQLRSLKRVTADQQFIFAGRFAERGRYTAILFERDKPVARIMNGIYPSGAGELTITSELLIPFVGRTFDLLLHDGSSDRSTTIAHVSPVLPY